MADSIPNLDNTVCSDKFFAGVLDVLSYYLTVRGALSLYTVSPVLRIAVKLLKEFSGSLWG